eukprot:117414-Rhodomonas_salina.1
MRGGGMGGGRGAQSHGPGRGNWDSGFVGGPPGGGAPLHHPQQGSGLAFNPNVGSWQPVGQFQPPLPTFGLHQHPLPPPNHPPPAQHLPPPARAQQMGPAGGSAVGGPTFGQVPTDSRAEYPANPVQQRSEDSNGGCENLNPTKAIMDVLSQTLKAQGDAAMAMQREQHAFLERMADKAHDTQVRMMSMISGKTQPQITDQAPPYDEMMEAGAGAGGQNTGLD